MMELNGEPTTRRWLPSHVYPDLATAKARMQYLISCYSSPGDPCHGPYVLAVEHIASGALIGHVGFSPFNGEVEVSYAIAENARGRGYGPEALVRAVSSPKRNTRFNELRLKACESWPRSARTPPAGYASRA
jgi:RimJ/RimL family protein N-acetyltransferase